MMLTSSHDQSALLGLCCIPSDESTICKNIRKQWDDRFDMISTLLYDVDFSDKTSLTNKIQVTDFVNHRSANEEVLISIFLDLRHSLEHENLRYIQTFRDDYSSSFACHSVRTIIFGYVGNYTFSPETDAVIDRNIELMLHQFPQCHILLVSEIKEGQSQCWIPVMAFLEVLRRMNALMEKLPADARVGYLEYGLYNKALRRQYEDELSSIEKKLSNDGEGVASDALRAEIQKLTAEARKAYNVNGGMQPLHPDLKVNPGIFGLGRLRATRPGGSFDIARNVTKDAAEKTAENMENGIRELFTLSDSEADQQLLQFTENIGLKLIDDGTVEKDLNVDFGDIPDTSSLYLAENLEDCETRIEDYLKTHMDAAIAQGKRLYKRAMIEACQRYRVNLTQNLEKNSTALRRKLMETRSKMRNTPDLSTFCKDAIESGVGLQGGLRFSSKGGHFTLCLCEADDQETQNTVQKAVNNVDGTRNLVPILIPDGFSMAREYYPVMVMKCAMYLDASRKKSSEEAV